VPRAEVTGRAEFVDAVPSHRLVRFVKDAIETPMDVKDAIDVKDVVASHPPCVIRLSV
jgi:hypothetical protein